MSIRLTLAAALLAMSASGASATTIDFESEASGGKPNGYTVSGVSFFDTQGADLVVQNYIESNNTNGLAVFSDDTSALRMLFSADSINLFLSFGNDEVCVPGNCPFNADRAFLQIFNDGTLVGSAFTLFNQNNVADQQVGISGIVFDEALLTYTNSAFETGNLIEVVDNISFDAADAGAVPEPSTWAMMLIGFGMVGGAMRLRQRQKTKTTFAF